MDLNYYLNITDFNAMLTRFIEIHQENIDRADLKRWNISAIMNGISSVEPDAENVLDAFEVLSSNAENKESKVRKSLNISDAFSRILNQYYQFRYDCYYMGFECIEDFVQYEEDLFNILDNEHQKNFCPIPADASEDDYKSSLNDLYNALIVEYFKRDLYAESVGFLNKLHILKEFRTLYDGDAFPTMEYMSFFNDCISFEDLFDSMNDYCQELIYPDDDGNPSDEDFTDGLILDCINWRK